MSALAFIRPSDWELPLFVHVLGALAVLGTLTLASVLLLSAARGGSAANLRLGLRVFAFGVIPSWIVLRGSAEWIASKEGFSDLDKPPTWIDFGYIAGDLGLLLILITGIFGWVRYRKIRDGGDPGSTARVAGILLAVLLITNVVALWAMTTKPA